LFNFIFYNNFFGHYFFSIFNHPPPNTDEVIGGLNKDIALGVCSELGVTCGMTLEPYSRCWAGGGASGTPGVAILGSWFNACIGWLPNAARRRAADFGTAFSPPTPARLVVASSVTTAPTSVAGKKVGVVAGFAADGACLAANSLAGAVIVSYATDALVAQAVAAGSVDHGFLFVNSAAAVSAAGVKFIGAEYTCAGGMSPMAPRGDPFVAVWNSGLERLRSSGKLAQICANYPTATCV
jgi:ABC-type amino acid transport substrate-binding protein